MSDPAAFQIVMIPISKYQHHPPLHQVEIEANRIIDLFREFGGQASSTPSTDQDLDETAVKNLLRGWATRETAPSGVLLWLGHGASDGDEAWLASFETPDPINGNGIVPKTLADQLDSDWRQRAADDTAWSLVVIEACGAGRFVSSVVSLLTKNSPRRLALIGVGGDGAAYLGRFSDALSRTAAGYTVNDEHVRLRDFINRLEDFLPEDDVYPLHINNQLVLPRKRLIDTPVSAPVDFYQALVEFLAALSPDERSHFIPKAQGAEHGELAWYFVGRVAERRKIAAWLRNSTGGMLIVTGRAGTGKSALLGNLLVHTNPGLRELLVEGGQLEREGATDLPPDHAFNAVVHLTGITTSELVGKIADAAGVALPTAESAGSGQDLEAVLANLRDRSFTILADALDEAQEPATIASTVLGRLAALPRTRVIVGTRASTREGPDQPFTTDQDLLDALGRGHATIMRIEREPTAIAAYVRRRLAFALGVGSSQASEAAVERVVALSSEQEREFLFARLAVHEIIARPELLSPEFRDELETLMGGDHRTLFSAAVARLAADSQTARQLLEALALARGRGVPRADRIWAAVAGAVGDGEALRETDIDHLLAAAAPYIMLDAEDGQSVYRLAHQTFREFFLSYGGTDLRARHRSVARALMAGAAESGAPNLYIVHRLAEHVAEAGIWQELADAPAVLDELDPESIAAEALRTAYGRANLPLAIAASLSARHLLSSVAVADRWMTRRIAMACIESADARNAEHGMPTACWAWLRRHDPLHVLLTGHDGPIRAATALHLADGRVLLATGGDDGTIRLWDPSTGRPVGDPLEGAGSPRFRLAAFHSGDGRTLLAIGGNDGRLRLWDPVNGQFHSDSLAGHAGSILGIVCFSREYGEDVIVTCGFDRTLLVWEMAVGRPITRRPLVVGYRVRALSSLPVPFGRTLLVTGGYDADVRLWDSLTGQPSGERLTGHSGAIHAVATLTLPDSREFVAAGGDDDAIRLWDSHGDPLGGRLLTGHSGAVNTVVAVPLPGGRSLLASGGEDATVRLWDPVTGQSVGEPLTGHKHSVYALATVVLPDGRTLLASGSEDKTVRIWDPSLARLTSRRPGRRRPRLHALAGAPMPDGRLLLMTGDDEGVIQLRDPRTGASVGQPMMGEAVAIHAIAAIAPPDGATMVAASGAGGSIVRWALHPQQSVRLGAPLYGHTGTVRAITPLPLPNGQVRLASAGNDDKIRLWDPVTASPAGVLVGAHRSSVSALTAVTTALGKTLLASAGDDSAVALWDWGTPARVARLWAENAVSFSALSVVAGPAGEVWLAAGASDGSLCLWNTSNFRLTGRLYGASDAVLSLACLRLPSGRELLAAGSADGCIRLWDAVDGALLRTIPLPFDQRAQNLLAIGTTLAIQTDIGVIVSELDPALAALPSSGSEADTP
jgi:WD40 repeat protein